MFVTVKPFWTSVIYCSSMLGPSVNYREKIQLQRCPLICKHYTRMEVFPAANAQAYDAKSVTYGAENI